MPFIKISNNEPFELALRRFKRLCEKSGILSEIKKREFYEKPSIKKKKIKESINKKKKKINILIIK